MLYVLIIWQVFGDAIYVAGFVTAFILPRLIFERPVWFVGAKPETERLVFGSFFQRLRFALKRGANSQEAAQALEDAQDALRRQFVGKPGGEIASDMAAAVREISKALENVDEAAIRMSNFLAVKYLSEGRIKFFACTLSDTLARKLDQRPSLILRPQALLAFLSEEELELSTETLVQPKLPELKEPSIP